MWSDQLVVNAPDNRVVVGKRAVVDDFVRTGIINFSSFERKAGQRIPRRFTNIWKRDVDTWHLFIRHANVIPPR